MGARLSCPGSLVAAVLLAAALATPELAWSHGGHSSPDLVHACVGTITKLVRIVGLSGSCTPALAEVPVHWPAVPQPVTAGTGPAPAGAGDLRVVDRGGKAVGTLVNGSGAAVDVGGGVLVHMAVSPAGFTDTGEIARYFEAPDCAGPAYMEAGSVLPIASIVGTLASYPDPARVQAREFQSQLVFGACRNVERSAFLAAPVLSVDLATLGFVPPFSVVR